MTIKFKFAVLFLAVVGMIVSPPVFAQEPILKTDSDMPTDRLQANCDNILGSLRRLHTNDALMRVNVGQMYNGISVRMMARLNSRLALNRIDSTELVEITSRFETLRSQFSTDYNKYEPALANLVKEDCKNEPIKFYELLLKARDERAKLSETVTALGQTIDDYQVAVENLKQQLFAPTEEDSDGQN